MKSQDIAIVGILLAAGAIVRYLSLVIPGPIVSNLVIAFYCLAIVLVLPSPRETLGIGLVAGIVCAMISHSIFPPANLISEPIGALVCLLVCTALRKRIPLAPSLSTFLGTLASGFSFVGVAMVLVAPAILTKFATIGAFALTIIPIVVITAFVNALVVQILAAPASRVVGMVHIPERAEKDEGSGSSLPNISPGAPIIDLRHYSFTYAGASKAALVDITLDIRKGEVLLVTGPTAAGKSTLCMAMAGILTHEYGGREDGSITFGGRPIDEYYGMGELADSIGFVFDDADAQLIFTTVEEEITSGLENRGLDSDAIDLRAESVMELTGIKHLRDRAPHTLSGGQKQRVALAATLALSTDVLILDEATSELDRNAVQNMVNILKRLKQEGKTIIIVDHAVDDFRELADRAVVLDSGHIRAIGSPAEVLSSGTTGRIYTPPSSMIVPGAGGEANPVISIHNLSHFYGDVRALNGVSLDIYPGELVAILGENGSGKTTMIKHLNGLLLPTDGEVRVHGYLTADTPVTELVRHTGLVFQNPDSMLFEDTVEREVAFGLENMGCTDAGDRLTRALSMVGLDGKRQVFPRHLSRGERQRLAVACILAMEPEVIVLDEPTTGLDAGEADRIMGLLGQLAEQGHTIIMVTHNNEIAEGYAERIIRFENGLIADDSTGRGGMCS
jgi:energy-coupling factor transporter ATP-binding protein EcfA2